MAEETKFELPEEAAKFFGTEKSFDSFDAFKEAFQGEDGFIRRSVAHDDSEINKKVQGKRFGTLGVEIQRIAKERGHEFTKEEKEMTIEEQMSLYDAKVNESFSAKVAELEGQIGSTDETQINELKGQLEKAQKKNEEKDNLLKDNKIKFEEFVSNVETEKKNTIIGMSRRKALDSLELPHDLDNLKKKGFESYMNETYKTDLDDEGKVFVTKDGARVPHPEIADTFMGLDDIYKMEADKQGVSKLNPHAGQQVQKPVVNQLPVENNNVHKYKVAKPLM